MNLDTLISFFFSTDLDLHYIYDHMGNYMGYLGFSGTRRSARLQNSNYLEELISQGMVTDADLDLFRSHQEHLFLNGSDMSSPLGN